MSRKQERVAIATRFCKELGRAGVDLVEWLHFGAGAPSRYKVTGAPARRWPMQTHRHTRSGRSHADGASALNDRLELIFIHLNMENRKATRPRTSNHWARNSQLAQARDLGYGASTSRYVRRSNMPENGIDACR